MFFVLDGFNLTRLSNPLFRLVSKGFKQHNLIGSEQKSKFLLYYILTHVNFGILHNVNNSMDIRYTKRNANGGMRMHDIHPWCLSSIRGRKLRMTFLEIWKCTSNCLLLPMISCKFVIWLQAYDMRELSLQLALCTNLSFFFPEPILLFIDGVLLWETFILTLSIL